MLPNSVFIFFYWIIKGTSDTMSDALTLSEQQEIESNQHQIPILYIGQELVYSVSKGKLTTA